MSWPQLTGTLRATIRQFNGRHISISSSAKWQFYRDVAQDQIDSAAPPIRQDAEWQQAKEYKSIPGPHPLLFFFDFMPGGRLHNLNMIDMNRKMREVYGDIYRIQGYFGKPDVVFTYNPQDIETTYRTEGVWPIRVGLETFTYYRHKKRPDVFQGVGGLVSDQGKAWADVRGKVNPVLMKSQNVRRYLPQFDAIAQEFVQKLERLRDPSSNLLTSHFLEELKMWSFESVCVFALNTRMGLMSDDPDPNARRLAENMSDFFNASYEYDVLPSFWKFYETAGFKRLMQTYDNITEITSSYIDAATKKFESEQNVEAKSVLEKLCRIDRKVAHVMATDMLMAGIDTTTSAFTTTLYHVARNPEKQEKLRQEVMAILPQRNSPLTEQNTRNIPYLRACIKEALRITHITPGNFRIAGQDIVLSGYKVPKGTGVLMGGMELCNTESHYPRSKEFLPERWLKSGEDACPHAKSPNPFTYLPFGFGPRTCIGKRIAEAEIETLLARLVRHYRMSWDSREPLKYVSNIITIPSGPMPFKFEPL